MKKIITLGLAGTLALMLTACASQKIVLQEGNASNEQSELSHFFFHGIAQTNSINPKQTCTPLAVESKLGAMPIAIGMFSAPVYTPRETIVHCK